MNNKILITGLLFLLCSCSSLQNMPEQMRPLPYRLVSSNENIKSAATGEYMALDAAGRERAISGIIEMFKTEEDPYKRARMLAVLGALKAGQDFIVPLILAATENKSIRDYGEITGYISSLKPSGESIKNVIALLKSDKWEVRSLAMASLSALAAQAGRAMPEMAATMRDFGADPGHYSEAFDNMAKIDPEIAVINVIRNLGDNAPEIRKNALEKLFELQTYLSPKLDIKKEIIPAIIRALYSGDKAISKLAEDGLSQADDPAAREAMENYLKMGRQAIGALMHFAGKSMDEVFKAQEQRMEKKLNDYYKSVGREDAVKTDKP
jgi:HEAT repeat protein